MILYKQNQSFEECKIFFSDRIYVNMFFVELDVQS